MKLSAKTRTQRRSGFTLIELLVVATIIALLVAMTAAGVFKTLHKIADVTNTREISDLQTGIINFQQKFGVDNPPPSRLVLHQKLSSYNLTTPGVEVDSASYLQQAFKGMTSPDPTDVTFPWTSATGPGIIWNPNNPALDPIVLEGDQCLVFFLGGIQATPNGVHACLGFSTNRKNPMDLTTPDKISPFFDFKAERLTTKFHGANTPFSYLDAYGKAPFAYFSSYKKGNGYNRYGGTDCPTLQTALGLMGPYVSINSPPVVKFHNADTFQIISAGRDGVFGTAIPSPPGTWNPATADQNITAQGRDDMANFYDRMLGVPAN